MAAPHVFGAFGKMPALGDFFQIGVAQGFVGPWDRWLQSGMVAARSALGDRWRGCFMSAPIWRFSLAAGLAGPEAAMGVLMPSVDRVGRQFPLTLVAPLPGRAPLIQTHAAAGQTFAALEQVALDALEDGMSRERLGDRLAALAVPLGAAPGRALRGPGFLAVSAATGPDAFAVLAAQAAEGMRAPSLWTTGSDTDARLMLAEGLPAPDRMGMLFDLDAPHWGQTMRDGVRA